MRMNKRPLQPIKIGSIHPYVTNRAETDPRSFDLLPDVNRFVATSSWDNSFHVFKIDAGSIAHAHSIRQKFSFLSTLMSAGGSFLLTSWRDSSIRLSDLSIKRTKYVYRIAPHLTSIVDIHASARARIIASLDKSRRCVLSMLYSGKYIRSFAVDGADVLEKVLLFSNGFVAVLSKVELPDVRKAIVRVFGIDARKLAQMEFDEKILEWTKAEFACALDALVLSFESKKCIILRIPDLSVLRTVEAEVQFMTLKFVSSTDAVLAVSADGRIWTFAPGYFTECESSQKNTQKEGI
jgi:hypothetical protein